MTRVLLCGSRADHGRSRRSVILRSDPVLERSLPNSSYTCEQSHFCFAQNRHVRSSCLLTGRKQMTSSAFDLFGAPEQSGSWETGSGPDQSRVKLFFTVYLYCNGGHGGGSQASLMPALSSRSL